VQWLETLARRVDAVNEHVGRVVAWTALMMVLIQFLVVIMRYVFAIGSIPVQESILYTHALLFLLGAGYTLKRDGHVRVDIFYREATASRRAAIDLFGVVVLLWPVCAAIFYYSWSFVTNSVRIREGSTEPSGLHLVFLLKGLILVFAGLVALQGLALAARSILVLAGRARTNFPPKL
jgi:TRAP-type mannitol/chloroaromatic compound transport system permease small subunit